MKRALVLTLAVASLPFWALAVSMAVIEVLQLASAQSTDHAPVGFAANGLIVAAVLTLCALAAREWSKTS